MRNVLGACVLPVLLATGALPGVAAFTSETRNSRHSFQLGVYHGRAYDRIDEAAGVQQRRQHSSQYESLADQYKQHSNPYKRQQQVYTTQPDQPLRPNRESNLKLWSPTRTSSSMVRRNTFSDANDPYPYKYAPDQTSSSYYSGNPNTPRQGYRSGSWRNTRRLWSPNDPYNYEQEQYGRRERNWSSNGYGYNYGYNNGYGYGTNSYYNNGRRIQQGSALVQGGSRSTWSSANDPYSAYGRTLERDVHMGTDGRPLQATLEVWNGPDNTPEKTRVYSEDGWMRPISTRTTTYGHNAMSIRNTGPLAFPLEARISTTQRGRNGYSYDGRRSSHNYESTLSSSTLWSDQHRNRHNRHNRRSGTRNSGLVRIQGDNSLRTFHVEHGAHNVEVCVQSEGTPIMAVVELWEGPGDARQIAEIYREDGYSRPFRGTFHTPGHRSCTIGIRNVGPMAYPIEASVQSCY